MSDSTGLFEIDLYQIDEVVPGRAELATDPLGQVVAVIAAYLPEGVGSSGYAWQETACLRADFAREQVELIRAIEGEYSVEGEWDLDVSDDDVRERLLLPDAQQPDANSFATLASWVPDLQIAPPSPEIRNFSDDPAFRDGDATKDWTGPIDEQ